MSNRTFDSWRVWTRMQKGVFTIDTGHLSARELAEYRDFVATIYDARITIEPQAAGTQSWLVIEPMRYSDIGLRVAEHFFAVPFSASSMQS